jgi:hypothetical protein
MANPTIGDSAKILPDPTTVDRAEIAVDRAETTVDRAETAVDRAETAVDRAESRVDWAGIRGIGLCEQRVRR